MEARDKIKTVKNVKMSNNTSHQHNVVTQVFYINNLLSFLFIGSGVEKGIIFFYNLQLEPENMILSHALILNSLSFHSVNVPPFHHYATSY